MYSEGLVNQPFNLDPGSLSDIDVRNAGGDQSLALKSYGAGAAIAVSRTSNFNVFYVKDVFRVFWHSLEPTGTTLNVSCVLDGRTFDAGSSGSYEFPAGTRATSIQYRVAFATTDPSVVPVLNDISFEYAFQPSSADPDPPDPVGPGTTGRPKRGPTKPPVNAKEPKTQALTIGRGAGEGGVRIVTGGGAGPGTGRGGSGASGNGPGPSSAKGPGAGAGSAANRGRTGWLLERVGSGKAPFSASGEKSQSKQEAPLGRAIAAAFISTTYCLGLASMSNRWLARSRLSRPILLGMHLH